VHRERSRQAVCACLADLVIAGPSGDPSTPLGFTALCGISRRSIVREEFHISSAAAAPSWAHFELLVNRLADGITVQDATGRLVYANEVGARMSGYPTLEAMLAAPVGDYVRNYDVTDADGNPISVYDLPGRKALVSGHHEMVLRVREKATGIERWTEVRAFAVADADGAPEFVFNIIRDVSASVDALRAEAAARKREEDARQRAESLSMWLARLQKLTAALSRSVRPDDAADVATNLARTLFEADAAGLWMLQKDRAALRLLGFTGSGVNAIRSLESIPVSGRVPIAEAVRMDEPVFIEGADVLASRYPDLADIFQASGASAVACVPVKVGGDVIGVLSFRYDAPRVFNDAYATALRTFGKQLGQALARTRMHSELEETQRAATAANAAKSSFLATMSHELRTPINAIMGFTDLLERGIIDGTQLSAPDCVVRIRKNTEHLLELINDVLDWSKVEAGQLAVDAAEIEAGGVIEAAMNVMKEQAVARGIELTATCADGATFIGDPLRVRQILLNLLSNALKFTPRGGRVTLHCSPSDGRTAFVIEDTGIGIAAENLESIFQPFVQAGPVYTRERGGTGLGLSISRRLAHLMGGDITVTSEVGSGSRFVLRLPSQERS
jgi:PAS domain S-box-containing protein